MFFLAKYLDINSQTKDKEENESDDRVFRGERGWVIFAHNIAIACSTELFKHKCLEHVVFSDNLMNPDR